MIDFHIQILIHYSLRIVQESAKILCGVKNKACIFDYLATKDDSFAKETKTINNEAQQVIKDIGKP